MKKKIYLYSGSNALQTSKKLEEFRAQFEIIPNDKSDAIDVLKKDLDFIEIAPGDFEKFKGLISAVGWKVSHLGVADVLVKEGTFFKPLNLVADCILTLIQQRVPDLSTSASVMVVGDYNFVLSTTAKLALAGFSKFIVSLDKDEQFSLIQKRLNEFIFNLDVQYVNFLELTQISSTSSMLISNMSEAISLEAYESLAYFNFLAPGAIYVDANSEQNTSLIIEARRAELRVIEEIEILTLKYKTLLEFSKISSFV